jgi:hypothetical protein
MFCKIGHHGDAIHGTGQQAQFAAGAFTGDHRVHQLARADDGIHGTGIDTLAAADAKGFIDHGACPRFVRTETRVERLWRDMQQRTQRADGGIAARGALIDAGGTGGERFGIGTAARVSALRALRLRQARVDTFDERQKLVGGC